MAKPSCKPRSASRVPKGPPVDPRCRAVGSTAVGRDGHRYLNVAVKGGQRWRKQAGHPRAKAKAKAKAAPKAEAAAPGMIGPAPATDLKTLVALYRETARDLAWSRMQPQMGNPAVRRMREHMTEPVAVARVFHQWFPKARVGGARAYAEGGNVGPMVPVSEAFGIPRYLAVLTAALAPAAPDGSPAIPAAVLAELFLIHGVDPSGADNDYTNPLVRTWHCGRVYLWYAEYFYDSAADAVAGRRADMSTAEATEDWAWDEQAFVRPVLAALGPAADARITTLSADSSPIGRARVLWLPLFNARGDYLHTSAGWMRPLTAAQRQRVRPGHGIQAVRDVPRALGLRLPTC